MNIIRNMSEHARANLRNNLHKVAAVKAQQEGVNLARDQITIKEAVYLLGVDLWRSWLEKRAMFEGLTSLRQLEK
jgi:hypothetical protein